MKNIKCNLLISLFLLITNINIAQNFIIENQITFGGDNSDWIKKGILTSDKNFLVGGTSASGISGDKTEYSRGSLDYWIVKFDSSLNEIWQRTLGGNSFDDLFDIIETSDGGYLCGGYSDSDISGDKTAPNKGIADYWVIKLDTDGNILWQNTYGGDDVDQLHSMVELDDASVILAGRSSSNISGDKTEDSRGGSDYWIVKIDKNGNKLWDKTYGGSDYEWTGYICKSEDGGLLLSGESSSNISSEKSENSYGSKDIWILKLDTSGNIIWDKTIGSNMDDLGNFVVSNLDFIYISSCSSADSSGLKTENSKGGIDIWLVKLDYNGNIIWDKTIGGNKNDNAISITITENHNLLLSGSSWSDISGDKTEDCRGLLDYWLLCLDTNGLINWQKTIGGDNHDYSRKTLKISHNTYILIGFSKSGISGEKTDYCRGEEDYWLVKLGVVNNIPEIKKSDNFIVFPNPTDNSFFIEAYIAADNKGIIKIYGLKGELLKELVLKKGSNKTMVHTSGWRKGIYICNLIINGKIIKSEKMVLAR
jgi:hypothetical protein